MKRIFSFILSFVFLTTSAFSPATALADTYGSGSYGSGTYNASGSNSTSVVSSISNTISAFFCTDQAPSSAPNLYQIDATSTTAKLYFSPAGGPYDKHYVSYGQGTNSEGYGAEFSTTNSKGAITYEVKQLSPTTVYTLKVRGGNGCKPGLWSNTLTIKTQTKGSKALAKFYPKQQAKYVTAKKASLIAQAQAFVSDLLPKGAPNTGLSESKSRHKQKDVAGASTQKQPSVLDRITNFFRNISP